MVTDSRHVTHNTQQTRFLTHYSLLIKNYAVALIIVIFTLTATLYSVLVPPFETPDEIWHFAFIQHVATGQGLPVSEPDSQALWRQQGVQAPGYYLAAAALTAWIDQRDFPEIYARANPHRAIGQPDAPANRNYLIHYPDQESWPWRGSILALHLARFFSVLLGAVTLYAVYRTLELLLDRSAALLGAAFVASIPQFIFISGSASNDNAINATAALVLWQLVSLVKRGAGLQVAGVQVAGVQVAGVQVAGVQGAGEQAAGNRASSSAPYVAHNTQHAPRITHYSLLITHYPLLGVFLGLALISKLSALALVGLAGLVVLGIAWRLRSWRPIVDALLWIGLPVLVIAGWWYGRNWLLYGDLLAWNLWQANILLRVVPADGAVIVGELGSLFRSFWGLFGWMNVGYPAPIYTLFAGVAALVGVGFLLYRLHWVFLQLRQRRLDLSWRFWAGGVLFLWLVLVVISWLRFMQIAPAAQGRYFFPAAPVLGLIFVLAWRGWNRWLPGRFAVGQQVGWLCVAILALLSAVTPFTLLQPAYAAPTLQVSEFQKPLATFGVASPQVAVVHVSANSQLVQPGDTAQVEIGWQALAPLSKDYSIFVHLVDVDGFVVAQYDSMPGGGRLPTSRWQPGALIVERYPVEIPATAYTPNRGRWVIGLYEQRTGQRLPLSGGSADSLVLQDPAEVRVETAQTSFAQPAPNPMQVNFADNVTLIGYGFNRRSIGPGDEMVVTLYWQARGPISQDYTFFAHILDQGYSMHGGHDRSPDLPTTQWFSRGEEIFSTEHRFHVSPDAPAGIYQFEVGLYLWPSLQRLQLLDVASAEGADRLILGPVRVDE
jgi:4-amino-4-deoxy-L-arabinose transferase-like glycosyltransferase